MNACRILATGLLLMASIGADADQIMPMHTGILPSSLESAAIGVSIDLASSTSDLQDEVQPSVNLGYFINPRSSQRRLHVRIGYAETERFTDLLPASADIRTDTENFEIGARLAIQKSWAEYDLSVDFSLQRAEHELLDTVTLASQAVDIELRRQALRLALLGQRRLGQSLTAWHSQLGVGIRHQHDRLRTLIDGEIDWRFKGDTSIHPWLQAGMVLPMARAQIHGGIEWSEDILLNVGLRFVW